jgi:hypothetical protein
MVINKKYFGLEIASVLYSPEVSFYISCDLYSLQYFSISLNLYYFSIYFRIGKL